MASATINFDRLAKITTLRSGSHKPNDGKNACVMELVSWVAGEPWSAHPQCTCPVITAFMVAWNDGLPNDAERSRLLLPLIPKLIGTRGDKELEARRATMAADWFVRVQTPAWLRLAGLNTEADALASFPEITSFEKTPSIMAPLNAARSAAEAAWSATRSATRSAAWSATRSAAWSAADSATRSAAWSAADSAAWSAADSAAWSAARSAAWSAAWSALEKTTSELQQSALALCERMIAAQPQKAPAKRALKRAV
jgi:hypothetical protein